MKINVKAQEKVSLTLSKVEGRSTTRTVSADAVMRECNAAEERLAGAGLPKAKRIGASLTFCGGTVAKAYKYGAKSTYVTCKRYPTGWFMVGAHRGYAPKGPHGVAKDTWLSVHVKTTQPLVLTQGIAFMLDNPDKSSEIDLIRSILRTHAIEVTTDLCERVYKHNRSLPPSKEASVTRTKGIGV